MPPLRTAARPVATARFQLGRALRAASAPVAKRLGDLERTVSSLPRFYIGRVSGVSPTVVKFRPGQEGEWSVTSLTRNADYAPAVNDWVLVVDMGRSPKHDPHHGGRVILCRLQLGGG